MTYNFPQEKKNTEWHQQRHKLSAFLIDNTIPIMHYYVACFSNTHSASRLLNLLLHSEDSVQIMQKVCQIVKNEDKAMRRNLARRIQTKKENRKRKPLTKLWFIRWYLHSIFHRNKECTSCFCFLPSVLTRSRDTPLYSTLYKYRVWFTNKF